MSSDRGDDLAARLRPHLRQRFDVPDAVWWSPPHRSGGARHPIGDAASRADQLVQVVERLALLVELGDGLVAAVTEVCERGRGRVVAELDEVCEALASGQATADAFQAWARRARCEHVGVLAADIRLCASSDALAAALWRNAGVLRRAARDRRMRELRRRMHLLWLLAAAVCAGSVVLVLQ